MPLRKKLRATPRQTVHCVICNKEVRAFPSENRKCCSKACLNILKSKTQRGSAHVFSEDGRRRLIAAVTTKENLASLRLRCAKATEASRKSPIAGPFETNRMAKSWRLVSPEGELLEFRNMSHFCRQRFGEDWNKWAKALRNLCAAAQGRGCWNLQEYEGWRVG